MCSDLGKEKTLQLRSSLATRILCFLRRLLRWLHCCGVHTCWRLDAGRMPPEGAKAVFSAGRGKPIRTKTIYQSIMEHQQESKFESRRTQLACRKMQTQIRRVAKGCLEFASCMEEVETRISRLEDNVGSQKVTQETMEKQLEGTQWKLTDLEDRLRHNDLRVPGIPEGVEGSYPRGFVVALFKEAFLDLNQWEWEREIQRAHRFPFNRTGISSTEEGGRPRAMLISLLNFQARQAVCDLARPNSRRKARGCDFFVRPDFCHTTVEKRWRLRQLIQPLQNKGAQAFLINPAKL
ncbi:hypothetical protein NDU88_003756 [Pleurodeles waltl]|uniref:Uncharacterized protein n=1 Tax=Pleurodeles waltl TaxID=8319 RepID=A0AAV7RF56_PLEWA|nr:hypothetical protein NDU88_003756 [Pleurodeles waltl]